MNFYIELFFVVLYVISLKYDVLALKLPKLLIKSSKKGCTYSSLFTVGF